MSRRWPPPDRLTVRRLLGFLFLGVLFGGLFGGGTVQLLAGEVQLPSIHRVTTICAGVLSVIFAIIFGSCGGIRGVLCGLVFGAVLGAITGIVTVSGVNASEMAIAWASEGHGSAYTVCVGLGGGIAFGLLLWLIDRTFAWWTQDSSKYDQAPGTARVPRAEELFDVEPGTDPLRRLLRCYPRFDVSRWGPQPTRG
jgi:hypothetical protein